MIIGLLLNILFCILIPHKIGRYRRIGFWGSAICCLLLTPLVGLIITLCSPTVYNNPPAEELKFRPKKKKEYKSEFPINKVSNNDEKNMDSQAKENLYIIFEDLDKKTLLSVIGVLQTVASVNGENRKRDNIIDKHLKGLKLDYIDCTNHLKIYGGVGMLDHLKVLSSIQKDFLIALVHEIIMSHGKPNENDLQITSNIFNYLGISDEEIVETVRRLHTINKHFSIS